MPERKLKPTALEQAGMEIRLLQTATLKLEEIRGQSMVCLHSLQEQPLSDPRLFELPGETGCCGGDDPVALCLRPREWLLVSPATAASTLLDDLQGIINPQQTVARDSSDGLAAFRLSGPGAPWLLSKLSCLDFLDGQKHGRHCARTKMGHVAVIVLYHQPHGDAFVFDLMFDRSIAKYLWLLLTESASHADELAAHPGDAK